MEIIGHEDSVTKGTYNIEEIEKSNENKVDIICKQSQQIEKLKDKLQKQAEWIENNKNKAKNCAIQMQNQGKEIQRLKQSNKDLMAVIWKIKRETANKGREVCKANNEVVQYKKRIAELEEQLKKNAIVPKFKVGQEIWEITPLMSWKIKRIEWHKFNGGNGDVVMEIYRLGHDGTDDYNCCIMPVDNDRFFAIKEEAQAKLKELRK